MDYINPHVRKILNVKENKSKRFNNYPSCRYNTQNFILAFIFSFLPPNKVNSIVIYSFFYNFYLFFFRFFGLLFYSDTLKAVIENIHNGNVLQPLDQW